MSPADYFANHTSLSWYTVACHLVGAFAIPWFATRGIWWCVDRFPYRITIERAARRPASQETP